jgi:multiple sugar transport system substrate-binding protein
MNDRDSQSPFRSPSALTRRRLLGRSLAVGGGALAASAIGPGRGFRAAGAAAQETPAAGKASGKLVSWGYGTENPVAEARVNAFKKAFPDVELEIVPTLEDQKLLTAVASKTVPDLLWLDRFATASWASRSVLMPLTDFVQRDSYDTSQFYESAVSEASWDDQLYGIPGGMDLRVLYVNSDALNEVGVDPKTIDTGNWDQLNEVGAKLVKRNGDQVQRWGFDNKLQAGYLYLWGQGNGGHFMNEDATETTFNDPKNVDALTWGVKTFDDQGGYQSYEAFSSTFQGDEQFARGLVAMTMYENWMLGITARVDPKLNFMVLPIKPRGSTEGAVSYTGGRAWYIPNGAKNPEAAWEFIKFMHTDDTWLLAANALKESRKKEGQPFIPTMTGSKTADQAQLDNVYETFSEPFDNAVKLFPEILSQSVNREISRSPAGSLIDSVLNDEGVLPALRKEKDPQQALDDANTAAQDEIDSL